MIYHNDCFPMTVTCTELILVFKKSLKIHTGVIRGIKGHMYNDLQNTTQLKIAQRECECVYTIFIDVGFYGN